ncbi:MAG TPA: hypothetical protein VG963_23765, partial [Polyangiaceae bacterium]|nr:hypothetical protein [Polyangiaceae bacterium]
MTRMRFGIGVALLASQALGAPESSWLAPPPDVAPESTPAPHEEAPDEARALREELQDLKKEASQREAFVVARGRAYVRLARAGLLPLSGGLEAFAAYTSRLERLRRALGRDLEREKQITAREIELSRALKSLEELPPTERSAMSRARAAILAAEERDQAFQRAFQSDASRLPSTAVYAAHISAHDRTSAVGGFGAQRGRLPFPLAGRSEIQTIPSP